VDSIESKTRLVTVRRVCISLSSLLSRCRIIDPWMNYTSGCRAGWSISGRGCSGGSASKLMTSLPVAVAVAVVRSVRSFSLPSVDPPPRCPIESRDPVNSSGESRDPAALSALFSLTDRCAAVTSSGADNPLPAERVRHTPFASSS